MNRMNRITRRDIGKSCEATFIPQRNVCPPCTQNTCPDVLPELFLYLPIEQCVQFPPSGPEYPELQVQAVTCPLPAGALAFAAHAWHISDTAPTLVENRPTVQFVHPLAPVVGLNFPGTQYVQFPPSGPEDPALQVQAVICPLPAGASEFAVHAWHTSDAAPTLVENCPTVQFVHSLAPVVGLNFPGAQYVQIPPSCPEDPALQMQAVILLLPAGALAFAVHARHTSDAAPTLVENCPTVQFVHPLVPVVGLNFPGTQYVQFPPLGPEDPALQMQAVC